MSSAETLPPATTVASPPIPNATLITGIALSSFAALLLELSLTRLFSVVLFYHFAFLAISIALLGLGAGGVFSHLLKTRLGGIGLRRLAAWCAALTAISIPFVLEIVLHTPVSLELTGGNFVRLSVIYSVSAVPFFLTGVQFSAVFARLAECIPRLYGADLTGGAMACLAVVPLLNWIGGPNAVLFAAVAAAGAAFVWSPSKFERKWAGALVGALLLTLAANSNGWLADVTWAKGVRRTNVEFARWNAISRVEVDRQSDGARVIVIDADANTYIMNADPKDWGGSESQKRLMASPPAVANVLRPHGDYAVIGPGGGVDVLRAVANGSPSVTGIEINPIIATDIMRRRYADFADHLYQRPNVRIHVSDGRSFIRSTPQKFDVVEMTLVDTWASTAAGAFALSENNLYTTEAFREYFEHLKPDGFVAVTRWEYAQPREALRVASVAMDALHHLGVPDAASHFIVVAQSQLDSDGINVGVFAKKTPFTPEEEEAVRTHIAANPPMQVLYSPSGREDNAFSRMIRGNDPYAFSRDYEYNVTPVDDNAPFFFFTLKPDRIFKLNGSQSMDWKVNLGVAVLVMLLGISFLAVLAFLVLPLMLQSRTRTARVPGLPYFIAVGLGYILVEVTFIQRFVLFLGHPTYALTVVIFLLLLASGAGSAVSGKWFRHGEGAWMPLLVIVAALLVYLGALPRILDDLVGIAFPLKTLVSGMVLAPLGFAMGMPFPTGLRALSRDGEAPAEDHSIEWAWAMNAAASVLGSVLAIVIAIEFGLSVTLTCGAGAYALALLFYKQLRPAQSGR